MSDSQDTRQDGNELAFLIAVNGKDEYTCVAVDDNYLDATGAPQDDFINRPLKDIFPPMEVRYLIEQYGLSLIHI